MRPPRNEPASDAAAPGGPAADRTGAAPSLDLSVARIVEAATVIDPELRDSPQYRDPMLTRRLGRDVLVKVETCNPLRSFKGRGAQYRMSQLPAGTTVVCGSGGGNFGQAIAYAAVRAGLRAEVFLAEDLAEGKRTRTAALGAVVHLVEAGSSPKAAAAAFAAQAPDRCFVEDGADAAISEGAGTIGTELAADGAFDTVVLPAGDGALLTGVATWLRTHAPDVRVVGVTAAAAPALRRSWQAGTPLTVAPQDRFAAGITIVRPTAQSVHRMRTLVDDVVAVSHADMRAAMRLALDTLGILPEPAGAAGLAAVAVHDLPGRVATVITGANTELDVLDGGG